MGSPGLINVVAGKSLAKCPVEVRIALCVMAAQALPHRGRHEGVCIYRGQCGSGLTFCSLGAFICYQPPFRLKSYYDLADIRRDADRKYSRLSLILLS